MSLRRVFPIVLGSAACALGATFACGPPSSFDNLVNGAVDASVADETPAPIVRREIADLPAPRQLSPSSTSWLMGSRPSLRWALTGPLVGARVELCRTVACDGDKKTFEATGDQLNVPEDLAPGMWFWHLYGTSADGFGTKPGLWWELLVRGGTRTPALVGGSFVDIDGDGRADLLAVGIFSSPPPGNNDELTIYFGSAPDSTDVFTETQFGPPFGISIPSNDPSIAAADIDGDGLTDITFSQDLGAEGLSLATLRGSPQLGTTASLPESVQTLPLTSPVGLLGAGDVDGDGYADVFYSTTQDGSILFGSKAGIGFSQPLANLAFDDAGAMAPPFVPIAGGFSLTGRSNPDVAFSTAYSDTPLVIVGFSGRNFNGSTPLLGDPQLTFPSAFSTGDYDGDGLSDLAFRSTKAGKLVICVTFSVEALPAKIVAHCFTPVAPPAGFGDSLTSADLEGDGKDELLIGSDTSGVTVLRVASDGTTTTDSLPGPYGARLTTILPGWTGQAATWAATKADGTGIAIFKGSQVAKEIAPHPAMSGFGKAIR